MPSLPQRKVGIVACSGEEIAEGTVTRLATLKVLHETRCGQAVSICLPLFLAGDEGHRAFARTHPTITVDGCDLRCAAKGTEAYSAMPAASIVVSEIAADSGIAGIDGRRCLNAAGKRAVEVTAERLGALIDEILGKEAPAMAVDAAAAGCSCGSGMPVKVLAIAGQPVEVVALPLIFDALREKNLELDAAALRELLEMVKIYNRVAPEAEAAWREALAKAYAEYLREASG